jgi:hypothetical protein
MVAVGKRAVEVQTVAPGQLLQEQPLIFSQGVQADDFPGEYPVTLDQFRGDEPICAKMFLQGQHQEGQGAGEEDNFAPCGLVTLDAGHSPGAEVLPKERLEAAAALASGLFHVHSRQIGFVAKATPGVSGQAQHKTQGSSGLESFGAHQMVKEQALGSPLHQGAIYVKNGNFISHKKRAS